jgi:hypothetical protein
MKKSKKTKRKIIKIHAHSRQNDKKKIISKKPRGKRLTLFSFLFYPAAVHERNRSAQHTKMAKLFSLFSNPSARSNPLLLLLLLSAGPR